jgi:hypothetical protein
VGGEGGSSSRVHLGERERRPAACGERERRVLTAEDSDTKLEIIRWLNLLVSQPFIYIYIYIYIYISIYVCVCVCVCN